MKPRMKAKRGSGLPKLPKLPKNGYKNVRKCGNSYQGYTPNKTHFTHAKPTAAGAAAALANKEFTTNTPKDAASVKQATKHKPAATGTRTAIFFSPRPKPATDCMLLTPSYLMPCNDQCVAQLLCSLSGPTR